MSMLEISTWSFHWPFCSSANLDLRLNFSNIEGSQLKFADLISKFSLCVHNSQVSAKITSKAHTLRNLKIGTSYFSAGTTSVSKSLNFM